MLGAEFSGRTSERVCKSKYTSFGRQVGRTGEFDFEDGLQRIAGSYCVWQERRGVCRESVGSGQHGAGGVDQAGGRPQEQAGRRSGGEDYAGREIRGTRCDSQGLEDRGPGHSGTGARQGTGGVAARNGV